MVKKTNWYRNFTNPELLFLSGALIGVFLLVFYFGGVLAPVFSAIILAYLLDTPMRFLHKCLKIPNAISAFLVFVFSVVILVLSAIWLLPLLWNQGTLLINELPKMITGLQGYAALLPSKYPNFITEKQIQDMVQSMSVDMTGVGKHLITTSLAAIPGVLQVIIYLILVPLMVFFFLKDQVVILDWFISYLPKKRKLAGQVWLEVNRQIGNYVRGKVIEIAIVGVVASVTFFILGLRYSIILGLLTGLVALIPYVGVILAAVPVLLVALFQWGMSPDFIYVLIAFVAINIIDGNLLVPILFSEKLQLNPVAIIIAVLFFGGVWGFWGIFFAIPLATVVKALLNVVSSQRANGIKK